MLLHVRVCILDQRHQECAPQSTPTVAHVGERDVRCRRFRSEQDLGFGTAPWQCGAQNLVHLREGGQPPKVDANEELDRGLHQAHDRDIEPTHSCRVRQVVVEIVDTLWFEQALYAQQDVRKEGLAHAWEGFHKEDGIVHTRLFNRPGVLHFCIEVRTNLVIPDTLLADGHIGCADVDSVDGELALANEIPNLVALYVRATADADIEDASALRDPLENLHKGVWRGHRGGCRLEASPVNLVVVIVLFDVHRPPKPRRETNRGASGGEHEGRHMRRLLLLLLL